MISTRHLAIIGYERACPGVKGRRVVIIDGLHTRQQPGETLVNQIRRANYHAEPIRGRLFVWEPVPMAELMDLAARLCPASDDLCPWPSDS